MPGLKLIMDGDGCWPDLRKPGPRPVYHVADEALPELAYLERGMQSGKPSVALRLNMADGTTVVWETSLDILVAAASAMKARSERDRGPPTKAHPRPERN